MIYCYLFEAKSIQSYLFESGKLKDVIAASERLDRLIDSSDNSLLHQVLEASNVKSDLLNPDISDSDSLIRFLRCKGGAFYCYSITDKPLLAFRSLWTLTIQQMFPAMEFTDALSKDEILSNALDKAHAQLAADRNTPSVKFPITTAPASRYQRTGRASVPMSYLAKQASMGNENNLDTGSLDLDTEQHRQAYQSLEMRDSAALQNKFTPEHLFSKFSYPIDLENDFLFGKLNTDLTREQREVIKDIALIHIDGNGLGILLMALKNALKNASIDKYRQGFRTFSEALNQATIIAARKATQFVYDQARYTKKDKRLMIPMRPIVLGGDDITLLCRADLALEYSQIFCREFKSASEIELKPLFNLYLKKDDKKESDKKNAEDNRRDSLKPYLTASGGILYHKAGHPFTHSHHLVEDLCAAAKKLTKSVNANDKQVGPAALAFHRLSNAVYESFDEIVERSLTFSQEESSIQVGLATYFVDQTASTKSPFDFDKLNRLVELSNLPNAPIPLSRWRQMLTHISMGDFEETNRIYHRGLDLCNEGKLKEELDQLLDSLTPEGFCREGWYWEDTSGQKQTIINDLLIASHFSAKSTIATTTTEQ